MTRDPFARQEHDDVTVLILLGIAAVLAVGGGALAGLHVAVMRWLVAHRVLVPAAADPLLPLPGAAGAGLDLSRLALAAAGLLAAVVLVTVVLRRRDAGER